MSQMSQGWSAQPSSSSPWNAGILLDVPAIMNQYPPGLTHGAWRASALVSRSSSDQSIAVGSKRPRPTLIRSNRRAPPPPTSSRVQPVPQAFPSEDPFSDRHSLQDENFRSPSPNYKSSPQPRSRLASSYSSAHSHSPSSGGGNAYSSHHHFQPVDALARQRAVADKEARLKVIASILLNRVNVVGKPMRRRPRNVGMDGERAYVRSGLARCISVAE